MIPKNIYSEMARNVLEALMREAVTHAAASGQLIFPDPDEYFDILHRLAQPTSDYADVDIVEMLRAKGVGELRARTAVFRVAWEEVDEGRKAIVGYVFGESLKGTPAPEAELDAVMPEVLGMVAEQFGLDIDDLRAMVHGDHDEARTHQKIQERIDAEVEAFRDEINSKLDSMFGGGGES